ncbi:MAG: amino acid-binding protein [Acidobacteria bacterium]|nr:amino acid-binding protein [Acidobacteriota bacterium]
MIRTELSLRLPNNPGALVGVCRLLSDERVNILAMALDTGGQLRLVVDNHVHGAAVLRDHHHHVTERDVIATSVPNAPGALAPALKLVSDAKINVEYAYGGGSDGGATAVIVLGVENAQRAAAAAGL